MHVYQMTEAFTADDRNVLGEEILSLDLLLTGDPSSSFSFFTNTSGHPAVILFSFI